MNRIARLQQRRAALRVDIAAGCLNAASALAGCRAAAMRATLGASVADVVGRGSVLRRVLGMLAGVVVGAVVKKRE